MSNALILFLLFGLAFVIFPVGASFFESPKIITAELLILALAGLSLYREKKFVFSKNNLSLLAIFLISIFHLLFMASQTTFLGNAFRGQGILLLWCSLLFAFLVSQLKRIQIPLWVIPVLLFLQLIASIFIEVREGRAIGTLGEPNALAAFAIFTWPFILSNKKRSFKQTSLVVFSLLLSVLLIIFSGSRSAFIALGIQLIFLLATQFVSFGKATLLAIFLLLLSLIPPIMDKETLYENRGEIWTTALYAGYEHPILGWGFGNTEVAFSDYNEKLYNRLRGYYVDSSHNIFLDWWVQGGFVGLTILVLLLFDTLKNFIKTNNRIYLILILGLLSVMSFNPVSVVTLVQFWFLIGYGATTSTVSKAVTSRFSILNRISETLRR